MKCLWLQEFQPVVAFGKGYFVLSQIQSNIFHLKTSTSLESLVVRDGLASYILLEVKDIALDSFKNIEVSDSVIQFPNISTNYYKQKVAFKNPTFKSCKDFFIGKDKSKEKKINASLTETTRT
jgi:hypothetical protein